MKKLLSAVFIVLLLSLLFAGCRPSVSDEFPKYESELQKITASDEYVFLTKNLLDIYDTYLEYGIWGKPETSEQMKENYTFVTDSIITVFTQVGTLIIVSKNSEIQGHALKHKAVFQQYLEFHSDLGDHLMEGKPIPDLKAFVTTAKSGLREVNDELLALKFK